MHACLTNTLVEGPVESRTLSARPCARAVRSPDQGFRDGTRTEQGLCNAVSMVPPMHHAQLLGPMTPKLDTGCSEPITSKFSDAGSEIALAYTVRAPRMKHQPAERNENVWGKIELYDHLL